MYKCRLLHAKLPILRKSLQMCRNLLARVGIRRSNETPYRYFDEISTFSTLTKLHIVIRVEIRHFALYLPK